MNWFSKKQIKTAMDSGGDFSNQKGHYWTMGDVNRYSHDAYSIKIYISNTEHDISVSLMASHNYLGTNQYSAFWKFGKNEASKASDTYEKVSKIVKSTCEEFISKEKPTSLFCPILRERTQDIQDRNLIRTNIPTINYSYRLDYSGNWDKNIYGPRYPSNREESFDKYLNSSIYSEKNGNKPPKGKFSI
jgi:hypothetical protein